MLVVYCTGRASAIPRGELPRCPTDATLPGMDELTERYVALWNEPDRCFDFVTGRVCGRDEGPLDAARVVRAAVTRAGVTVAEVLVGLAGA